MMTPEQFTAALPVGLVLQDGRSKVTANDGKRATVTRASTGSTVRVTPSKVRKCAELLSAGPCAVRSFDYTSTIEAAIVAALGCKRDGKEWTR